MGAAWRGVWEKAFGRRQDKGGQEGGQTRASVRQPHRITSSSPISPQLLLSSRCLSLIECGLARRWLRPTSAHSAAFWIAVAKWPVPLSSLMLACFMFSSFNIPLILSLNKEVVGSSLRCPTSTGSRTGRRSVPHTVPVPRMVAIARKGTSLVNTEAK